MLSLDQTTLLLDGLKPPPGMEVDVAVGTTFTLDLTALLAIPIAASLASDGDADSADLLEVVRRYAERTVLFSQAGAIVVPPRYRAALTLVEQSVVEVRRPPGGIFHPKLWVVRFSGLGEVLHRVLVMSRNLTFDRSWDVVVRLDEEHAPIRTMNGAGVGELLTSLPSLAARGLSPAQSDLVHDVAKSLSGARLAVPEPFESGSFVPRLGGNPGRPFHRRCENALAISPFLSEGAVGSFLGTASEWAGVVSRPAALDASVRALRDADQVLRLKDSVLDAERTIEDTFDSVDDTAANGGGDSQLPHGLHAKVYVQDHGENATCWIGSANLTAGALATNIELMVQLTGPVSDVGVKAVLSPTPRRNNLSWFVEEHPLPESNESTDAEEELSELDAFAFDLASGDVAVRLIPVGDHWDAELTIEPWQPPDGVSIRARLLSLDGDAALDVVDGGATWSVIPLNLITPFVVLEARSGGSVRRTLVRAHLVGDPEDRRRSVIANAIASREDFLQYLAALLGVELGFGAGGAADGFFAGGWAGSGASSRVLEDLLLTASRHPARLASLDDTLKQLRRRSDVAQIVPDDFRQLWDAVYASRKALISG